MSALGKTLTKDFLIRIILAGMSVGFLGGIMIMLILLPPTRAVTEEDPSWDCATQGNLTCNLNGQIMTNVTSLPDDPYDRCVFLLDLGRRLDPDQASYAASVCEPIRTQLG